jgi:Cof subfamily protein (haloacid dehalogenase superfamily)
MQEATMDSDIQILFVDIDGTIFHDGRLVPSAVHAIRELHQRQQLTVALCTGRSTLHARPIVEQLGIQLAIYFNGSLVHASDTVVHATPMRVETVRAIRRFSEKTGVPAIYHSDDTACVLEPIPETFHSILKAYDFPPLTQVDETLWSRIERAVFQVNLFITRAWDVRVQNLFPDCLLYRWDERAVDLQVRGSDKSIGARALLRHLGIPPERAAHIGDGGNDVGMFGLVADSVAMGNAPPEVQRFARHVARPVYQDGFVHALELLGLR